VENGFFPMGDGSWTIKASSFGVGFGAGRREIVSPESVLPEDDLVFFLLDAIPQLDLSAFYQYYSTDTRGQPPFNVQMMVTLLVYSYCVGVFSSRKIAASLRAELGVSGDRRGRTADFRTISDFRKNHARRCAVLLGSVSSWLVSWGW